MINMTIETILIILLIAEVFLIFVGRDLILKLAKKLNEVVEELRKNNYTEDKWLKNWDCPDKFDSYPDGRERSPGKEN